MRMKSRMIAALAGVFGALGSSAIVASPLVEIATPFAFKAKPAGNKPNKVSQKKKRLYARRLNKHK